MSDKILDEVRLLVFKVNDASARLKQFKNEHPETRLAYYADSPGSWLNAYREGDLSFEGVIEHIEQKVAEAVANQWTAIEDGLPDEGDWYLVATNKPNGIENLTEIDYFDGTWNQPDVVAWMQLPKPYQAPESQATSDTCVCESQLTALKAESERLERAYAILREGLEDFAHKGSWFCRHDGMPGHRCNSTCNRTAFNTYIKHGFEVASEALQKAAAVREKTNE